MSAFIRGAWCADRPANALGVPGDTGKLALAVLPLRAGENARRDLDEARGELEDREGGPGLTFAGSEGTLIQRFRHAIVREVLDDHFREVIEHLHLVGVFFQVRAIARDAGAVGNFLIRDGPAGLRALRLDLYLALPLHG